MRRMPFNIEAMEKLAKEIHYNAETNTLEVGGNLYTDGTLKGHLLFGDGTEMKDLYIYFLNGDMVIFNYIDGGIRTIGIGCLYIPQEKIIYGIAYDGNNDQGGYVELDFSNEEEIVVNFRPFAQLTGIPKYYEHQLKVTTANTFVYLSYSSKNNLVIDSLQDLTKVVKPNTNTRLGFGTGYLYYEGNVWKSSTTNEAITAVSDNVVLIN